MQTGVRFWVGGLIAAARVICGIRSDVKGLENLPAGPVVIASKHQSAWDTFFFHGILPDPVYVMKQELLQIPFFGWYARKAGCIGIDRSGGAKALKGLVDRVGNAIDQGQQVVVFPEGTRIQPGRTAPLHPGIAALYARCRVPVVPVALNSGLLWGREAFRFYPGTVTVRIHPPMPCGLERRSFLQALSAKLDDVSGVSPVESDAAHASGPESGRLRANHAANLAHRSTSSRTSRKNET